MLIPLNACYVKYLLCNVMVGSPKDRSYKQQQCGEHHLCPTDSRANTRGSRTRSVIQERMSLELDEDVLRAHLSAHRRRLVKLEKSIISSRN